MPKERSANPAAQQRKADKQKEIARSRKQHQAQRNEKLARRNPDRLQRQIDELKDLERTGVLRPKDKETLQQLERDVKGVRRAREALGYAAPKFAEWRHEGSGRGGHGGGGGGGGPRDARQEQRERRQHLGKRRRGSEDAQASGSETDEEVRRIPMPRDTPPPFPRPPRQQRQKHNLPPKPTQAPAQTTYSSAPQIRDLKKEALKFMPAAVSQNRNRIKGTGGRLLEPEEADRLEKSGYMAAQHAADEAGSEATFDQTAHEVAGERERGNDLDEEARRFENEIASIYPADAEHMGSKGDKGVEMEKVEDEGT
ncbi:hypothetical protein KC318_g11394 [Hortaea werneckii]|uniref:Wbp11/ELF5/Saf1 N-terminal domain-containing protein n=1 Tax=Hortaea werneckii TaxID=91943 RepID=A0A3M7A7E9_HORWE|nr:hypothetical protein KC334_g6761 [Hortaea werneckii]KAI7008681.1 hypothetical protein KC355_g6835 [Hortaea werneckii]KAI7658163.1 hypothetical protein KC318_g11394 [Hortaea werneckii]RMY23524.1 hypothetical protein D0867_01990 [Hortaea werneckii]RMY39265.1 hypothetical protein D0866_02044 [Hortaea werneckii]